MKHQINQLHEMAGLMSCLLTHEVEKSTYKFDWLGPKLDPDLWCDVLAFLKHGYDVAKGEVQLRLYVNATLGIWGAWAFPQKLKTGLHTETEEIKETQQQLIERCTHMGDPDPAHWTLMGTVHSHCSASAFQSGTDEEDERKSRYGLHITIGHLDRSCYDFHSRFYVAGVQFNPDMSLFWDVAKFTDGIHPSIAKFLNGAANNLARELMCQPPPKEWKAPQCWVNNLILPEPEKTPTLSLAGGSYFGTYESSEWGRRTKPTDFAYDLDDALEAILSDFSLGEDEVLRGLLELEDDGFASLVIDECVRNDVSLEGLVRRLEERIAKGEKPPGKSDVDDQTTDYA